MYKRQLQIVASDPDAGDTLTYAATGLPNGLNIDANGIITGTPTFTTGLPQTVVITVTDDGNPALNATVAFDWTITPPNQAPAINPVLDRTTQAGVPITPLQIVASDADAGDTLTYAATGLPNGLNIDANGEITGTPTFTTGLAETVTITVTDDGNPALETTVTFDWTITPPNQAPVADPVLDRTNQAGVPITPLPVSYTHLTLPTICSV